MRIAQITLASADPAGQAEFWGERLGLPVQHVDSAVEVRLHRSTLRFEPAHDGANARYHFAINVPRNSIEEAAAWLGERQEILEFHDDPDVEEGATIVRGDRGASSFYFLDGAGNVVELMANPRIDDELHPPFGPNSCSRSPRSV
jgi:catechol-2,3-dioxygenase